MFLCKNKLPNPALLVPSSKLGTCKHLAQQVEFAHETSCLFRLTGAQKISANVACVLTVLG